MDKEYVIEKLLISGFNFVNIGICRPDKNSSVQREDFFNKFVFRWKQLTLYKDSIQQIWISRMVFTIREQTSFINFMNNYNDKTEILSEKKKRSDLDE